MVVASGDKAMAEGVNVASIQTPFGYQLEARIPASHFPAGLQSGAAIRADITTVHLDPGEAYLANTSFRWSGSKWSAFSNREYGQLKLRPNGGQDD